MKENSTAKDVEKKEGLHGVEKFNADVVAWGLVEKAEDVPVIFRKSFDHEESYPRVIPDSVSGITRRNLFEGTLYENTRFSRYTSTGHKCFEKDLFTIVVARSTESYFPFHFSWKIITTHKFAAFAIIRGGDYPRSDDAKIQQIKQRRG